MSLEGKVCLVTGAASGIGQQLTIALARQGATVVVIARDAARAAGGAEAVRKAVGDKARVESLACDVASLSSIRSAAHDARARYPKIHLLVNNAAVYNQARRTSPDGFELGFAVNNLAPYLFTTLLRPSLEAAAPSRVVMVTMPTRVPFDFDDPQSERSYKPVKVLQMTKGCMQYVMHELSRSWRGNGVAVVAVSPGLTQSKLPAEAPLPLRLVFRLFGKTPEQGARVPLEACVDPKWKSGDFVSDKGALLELPAFIDDARARRLCELDELLTNPPVATRRAG